MGVVYVCVYVCGVCVEGSESCVGVGVFGIVVVFSFQLCGHR